MKPNMIIHVGMRSPQPLIPALFAMPSSNVKIIIPAISKLLGGKTFLCEQMLFEQIENFEFGQSVTSEQLMLVV